MKFLKRSKESQMWRINWHYIFAAVALVSLAFLIAGLVCTISGNTGQGYILLTVGGGLFILSLLSAFFIGISLFLENIHILHKNNEAMNNVAELLNRQDHLQRQISQAVRLSDTAKEIVYRDSEQLELGEAALSKLHQHDFDAANTMIDEMAKQPKYLTLAQRLKSMADRYRNATEEGKVKQIIEHIQTLFDQELWAQAAAQIDNLVKTFPYSERAKKMHAKLRECKNMQKRKLLAAWDKAVKDKDTDRSLEILKDLDLYLTPSEALALQESASSVFRTKLHNLGVAFSLAVTDKNWEKAHTLGRTIINQFPNSRMAAEIREKMDILNNRATQKATENQNNQ